MENYIPKFWEREHTMSPVRTKLFNPSISYQCTVLNNDDAKRLSLLLPYFPAVALVPSFKLILNYSISIEDTKQITIEINVFLILASRGVF